MRSVIWLALVSMFLAVFAAGCRTPSGDTRSEKRNAMRKMHDETLAQLYAEEPAARAFVNGAPGYAVFSSISAQVIFVGGGNGYGLAVDNRTGRRTYMRMAELGAGLGAGFKDWRAVFVFHDTATMRRFTEVGWDFGGDTEAAAITGETGGEISRGFSVQGMTIFQFTVNGLSANIMVAGTKYWRDEELNLRR